MKTKTPEIVNRVLSYAGKKSIEVPYPCITTNECIDLSNYLKTLIDELENKSEKLSAPAQVYHTVFREGVSYSTVIGAAQRFYEFMQEPKPDVETLKIAREEMKKFLNGELKDENYFTPLTVKQVRDFMPLAGCGLVAAKKYLTETNGDTEKALELVRKT